MKSVKFCSILSLLSILFLFLFFAGCDAPDEREIKDPPELLVPRAVDLQGEPVFDQNRIYAEDYSNALHAVFMVAGNSRESEMGNAAYSDSQSGEMETRARQWLEMVDVINQYFNSSGRITSWYEETENGYVGSGSADLSIYPHLVYAYHMHHRGSRFEEYGLADDIVMRPLSYIVSPGRYLLENHYRDGMFFHDGGKVDAESMSYGLGGIHGHIYAWVSWSKPDGAEDMGMVDEDRLIAWMGYSKEDLAGIALEVSTVLDNAWDESREIYDFSGEAWATGLMPSSTVLHIATAEDGTVWRTDALGAMIRGHKALYEALHIFGDGPEYTEAARQLFDRSVRLYEQTADLARPWGLPETIRFTTDGAEAATDRVDVYHSWQYMNHIGGGFAWDREREGTARLITNEQPDLLQDFGNLCDLLLQGALDHQMKDGRLVTTLNYEDGSIENDATSISASGMFITAAGNLYRKGSAFERASDWENVPEEVRERSRLLYDSMISHLELIDSAMR